MSDMQSVLAILGYHKVGEPPPGGWHTYNYVAEETFADHLRFLAADGWAVVDLATALRGLDAPGSLPPKAALITFDDGYLSNLTVAAPWLRRFGFPAVVFVPTAFIGGRNSFDADIFYEPPELICDWAQLRELERAGVSVQSHGVSHRRLSELDPAEVRRELTDSKAALEGGLGHAVDTFAFPYGDQGVDPDLTRALLRDAGYRAACLYGGGAITSAVESHYALPRLAVGPDTALADLLPADAGGGR